MQYILIKNINKKAPRIFYYPNATNMLPFYKICVRYCYGKRPYLYKPRTYTFKQIQTFQPKILTQNTF